VGNGKGPEKGSGSSSCSNSIVTLKFTAEMISGYLLIKTMQLKTTVICIFVCCGIV